MLARVALAGRLFFVRYQHPVLWLASLFLLVPFELVPSSSLPTRAHLSAPSSLNLPHPDPIFPFLHDPSTPNVAPWNPYPPSWPTSQQTYNAQQGHTWSLTFEGVKDQAVSHGITPADLRGPIAASAATRALLRRKRQILSAPTV